MRPPKTGLFPRFAYFPEIYLSLEFYANVPTLHTLGFYNHILEAASVFRSFAYVFLSLVAWLSPFQVHAADRAAPAAKTMILASTNVALHLRTLEIVAPRELVDQIPPTPIRRFEKGKS